MGDLNQDQTIDEANRMYMERAEATSNVPLIFLNPNALNRGFFMEHAKTIDPADIPVVRQMLDDQIEGISANFTDDQITHLAGLSMDGRHFSLQQELPPAPNDPNGTPFRFAFINLQGDNVEPSGIAAAVIESSPTAEIYWSGFWGMHEGSHADFDNLARGPANNFGNPGKNEAMAMNAELVADREGLAWLTKEGQTEIVQAIIDYRAMNATADPLHSATAILADEPDVNATVLHFQAAREFLGVMLETVAQDQDINSFEAISLLRSDVEGFNGHLQRLMSEGAFDNASSNPYVRQYIEAYSGAVQRQITDRRLAQESSTAPSSDANSNKANLHDIKGGTPIVALANGDAATLTIGGVSAPQFFSANANLVLAEQRIALAQAQQPSLESDFKITAGSPALR